ncbi:MAG: DUF4209 domain-containing protein [Polyangiaceae bacterium]
MQEVIEHLFRQHDWSQLKTPAGAATHLRQSLATEQDEVRGRILDTLVLVLDLHPDYREDAETPFFGPHIVAALDQNVLQAIVATALSHPLPDVLLARLVDVAWQRRACNHSAVERAISAYLTAAKTSLDVREWLEPYEYARRAIALSAQIRRGSAQHAALLADVAALVTAAGDTDPLYFSAKMMGALINQRFPHGASLAAQAGRIAAAAASSGDFERARTYLETKHAWHRLYRDKEGEREVAISIAEMLEAHAVHRDAIGETAIAVQPQSEAVVAWQRAGERDRARQAHVRLQELQRRSVKGFKSFHTGSIDVSESIANARDHVSKRSRRDAILALTMISRPATVARLKRQAQDRLNSFLFYSLFPHVRVNPMGRRTHISGTAMAATAEEREAALVDEARLDCTRLMEITTVALIIPAAMQLQLEHGITTRDMLALVERSAFVPPGRRISFARGLALGFQGEFGLAAHVLMPQFENALREFLERRGAVVSKLPPSGIQDEVDLNKVLTLQDAVDLLGEDEHFELSTLLVERAGVNLRNELAHGLFDDGTRSAMLAFFWWKVLRYVVVLTTLANLSDIPIPEEEAESEGPENAPDSGDQTSSAGDASSSGSQAPS